MNQIEKLLFANELFYRAFSNGDIKEMRKIWLQSDDVTCIHPGWGAIRGYEKVLNSWESILRSAEVQTITALQPQGSVIGDMGLVICFEQLEGGVLITTNLFYLNDENWSMIHHQASPTTAYPSDPSILNTHSSIH